MSIFGVQTFGIKTPLIHDNDNLVEIIKQTMLDAMREGFSMQNGDVLCITESVVARSQGNYATRGQIVSDLQSKFDTDHLGVVFPIMSRNRFAEILRAISAGFDQITLQMSYPSDEVGNHLVKPEQIMSARVNPSADNFASWEFQKIFGETKHEFTGVDYIKYYLNPNSDIEGAPAINNIHIVLSNDPTYILRHTPYVLAADIHSRHRTKKAIADTNKAEEILGLDEIMNEPGKGGYNPDYGLLGSNLATPGKLKLFPRDCKALAQAVQRWAKETFGIDIEVMVYGDGAFKDPVGKIWELADPVVSPGFTDGLEGTPNEVKLKYQIDSMDASGKSRADGEASIKEMISAKNKTHQLGTTPRQYTDLLGSLADLCSGSGDKGTPLVLVRNYFDNYYSR
ncbi:MAG: coenzyme F420-0:L-glutamate ligase [Rickettsiales bacterium]|jgi:F420-0:gamma-glutamyl ligase|nr:coenzyme F420-0:L-glutamate ligase [Rickettsiales bacterium]